MNKKANLIQVILAIALASPFINSSDVRADEHEGHGGDGVICRPSPLNPLKGIYSLDYAYEYQLEGSDSDIVDVASWGESEARILNNLREKAPALAKQFADFSTYIMLNIDAASARTWEKANFGLVDIKDENLLKSLPPNCVRSNGSGILRFHQLVIRKKSGSQISYLYDNNALSKLRAERPLQFSHVMVHEWLWDLTDDVETIRSLNRFIHSKSFDEIDADGFARLLARKGVTLHPGISLPKPGLYMPTYRMLDAAIRVQKVDPMLGTITFSFVPSPRWATQRDPNGWHLTVFGEFKLKCELVPYMGRTECTGDDKWTKLYGDGSPNNGVGPACNAIVTENSIGGAGDLFQRASE